MIASVFFFTYWLAGRFGMDDKLRAVMSTALSFAVSRRLLPRPVR